MNESQIAGKMWNKIYETHTIYYLLYIIYIDYYLFASARMHEARMCNDNTVLNNMNNLQIKEL